MEEENTVQPEIKKNRKKIIIIVIAGVILFIILLFIVFRFFPPAQNPNASEIAPSATEVENPQGINTGLTFTISNFELLPGESATTDVELFTVQNSEVSGGTFVITYDMSIISDITLTPIVGDTGLFGEDAIVSNVQYNPENIVFSIDLPEGAAPVKGQGRIAELNFTTIDESKGPASTKLSFDMTRSTSYLVKDGTRQELKTAGSDLDIKFIDSPVAAPDAQDRLQQQQQLIQETTQ